MKVAELKEVISKYEEKDKDKLIVELYKSIPKKMKEDKEIDDLVLNINKPKEKKQKEVYTIDELEEGVTSFILNANYGVFTDRRNKSRTTWRFTASKYYKELIKFNPKTGEGVRATTQLIRLYNIINYGSKYLTFNNWNTFNAIKVDKGEFVAVIMDRILVNGNSIDNVKSCVNLLDYDLDPFSYIDYVFIYNLKDNDTKDIAIDIIKEYITEYKSKITKYHKDYKSNEVNTERVNFYADVILKLFINAGRVEEGIKYYKDNYISTNEEAIERDILGVLEHYELREDWVEEYEKHLKQLEKYTYLKEQYEEYTK